MTAFVSVSRLYGTWHDPDFTNVDRMLFDASLSWRAMPFRIDLTAWRRASETTFPISPITIDTAYSAMVSWNVEPEVTLTASADPRPHTVDSVAEPLFDFDEAAEKRFVIDDVTTSPFKSSPEISEPIA